MKSRQSKGQSYGANIAVCVLACAALVACGGGGGGAGAGSENGGSGTVGGGVGSSPDDGGPVTPQPGPGPSPFTPEAGTAITADTLAQRNTRYDVMAASGVVKLTLPPFIVPGDFVSIRGLAGSRWQLVPNPSPGTTARSDMTPQAIFTDNLPGNIIPGQLWKTRLGPMQWGLTASDQTGQVLVAAQRPGGLSVSGDAGENWSPVGGPHGSWMSVVVRSGPYPGPAGGIFAVQAGGGLFQYDARHGTWNPITSSEPGVILTNRNWQSITADPYGRRLVAAVFDGPIYRNDDARATGWQVGTLVGSDAPLIRRWRSVAMAGFGQTASGSAMSTVVAANEEGQIYISMTSGRTWELRNVRVNGAVVNTTPWHRIAISDDAKTIAVAGQSNSALYISRDSGLTWAVAGTPVGNYTDIAISADASVIAASLADGNGGQTGSMQISRNGGASFTPVTTLPGGLGNLSSLAMSADGNQYVASSGGTVYTSLGNRTSIGLQGAIEGGANDFVELEFLGNARFKVRQFQGGPFTIR